MQRKQKELDHLPPVSPGDGVHCVIEQIWIGSKQQYSCHMYTDHEVKKDKCKENIESIGPLTAYVSRGYGGYGVMKGYEEMWISNEQ